MWMQCCRAAVFPSMHACICSFPAFPPSLKFKTACQCCKSNGLQYHPLGATALNRPAH